MVYQKFAKEELFRKMQKVNYLRYVCLPLPSLEQIRHGDLIVFQEVDRGRNQTGRLTVAEILPAALAESENGQRIVMELELKHMQEGGEA